MMGRRLRLKRFCTECGREAGAEDKVCVHCGTPLEDAPAAQSDHQPKQKEAKAPMPKKKRIMIYSVISLLVVIIGVSIWANTYQSEASVLDRFTKAFDEEDDGALKKLMIHEDGKGLSQSEVNAF